MILVEFVAVDGKFIRVVREAGQGARALDCRRRQLLRRIDSEDLDPAALWRVVKHDEQRVRHLAYSTPKKSLAPVSKN